MVIIIINEENNMMVLNLRFIAIIPPQSFQVLEAVETTIVLISCHFLE